VRREYPEAPLVGVGGVILHKGKVLLIRRGQEPGKDTWGLPGGLVEVGETIAEALRREVAEETGLEVDPGPVLGIFEPITRDEESRVRYHYVVIDLLATVRGGALRPASDVADARWVGLDELTTYPLRRETLEMIRRAQNLPTPQASAA
jgi:8-oxo-dGTP diphosphatase